MKKAVGIILGVVMLAPVAMSQEVLSANAVGYVKLSLPADGSLLLARHDFVNIDGSATVLSDLLGLDLPDGTTVFKWDRAAQQYVLPAPTLSEDFAGVKSWSRTDIELERGDAFFIQNGPGAPVADVVLVGEVPGANNSSDTTVISPAEGFTGYPYPASIALEDTALADAVPVDTTVFIWNAEAQSYNLPGPTKSEDFAGNITWTGNPTINPGEGFWVDAGGANVEVTETKPYDWP